MILSKIQTTLCLLLALWLTGNCIDEDLSNCGVEAQISYTLEIVAELEAELEAQLDTTSDPEKQSELKKKFTDALNSIFTTTMSDLELSFYDSDSLMAKHELVPGENLVGKTYTVYLPLADYSHIAIANIGDEQTLQRNGNDKAHTFTIGHTNPADTVDSHIEGVFRGQLDFTIADANQHMYVPLRLINSATIVNLYPVDEVTEIGDLEVYIKGTADGFQCRDSVYNYPAQQHTRTNIMRAGRAIGAYGVSFPSTSTNAISRTDSDTSSDAIWQVDAYITNADGTTTKNTINITKSLDPGKAFVINGTVGSDGSITLTTTLNAYVAIETNWKPGNDFEIEI